MGFVAHNLFPRPCLGRQKILTPFASDQLCVAEAMPNSPLVDRSRHVFADIAYIERDLSGRSEWNIILDYRNRNHGPQLAMGIER